jgi:hypothetical protein
MFLRVLGVALLILAIAIVAPVFFVDRDEAPRNLPWQIEPVDGTIRVFGITLDRTSVAQAEEVFGEPATVSLFRTTDDEMGVEVYFDRVNLSGLDATLVGTVDLDRDTLQQMFERGLRVSTLGSGTRKVTLAPQDLNRVMNSPLSSLTYLPKINLSADQVRKRFGEPARKVPDPESGAEHWLYPDLGLDVALNPKQKEVLQYVPPERFGSVEAPLLEGQP